MFDHTSSAARANMATRGLYVFTHDNAFGNAPMHQLIERVRISRKDEIELPRSVSDYTITVDVHGLPAGVTFDELS